MICRHPRSVFQDQNFIAGETSFSSLIVDEWGGCQTNRHGNVVESTIGSELSRCEKWVRAELPVPPSRFWNPN